MTVDMRRPCGRVRPLRTLKKVTLGGGISDYLAFMDPEGHSYHRNLIPIKEIPTIVLTNRSRTKIKVSA